MNGAPWDDPALYEDLGEDGDRAARRELLRRLVEAGVSRAELRAAVEEERVTALPAELALGGETPHTLTHVARSAGLDPAFLRQVLLALGRPNPRRGERAFTDADIEEARILRSFVDAGLPRKDIVGVARVLGHGMANTAVAIRDLVADALLKRGDAEHDLAFRYAEAAERLTPLLSPLLGHELLAHLREVVRREAVTQAEREMGSIRGAREVAVAFADLVDFTKLGAEVQPDELGGVATRLSDITVAIAPPRVQLVKTIGDAVMLASADVAALLDTVLKLVEATEKEGPSFPKLRAGVAYGPAVTRTGDWFGAPVNLASRLTDAAKPGTVHVSAEAQAELVDRYDWPRRKRRALKGLGRVSYFRLNPQTPSAK